MNDRISSPNSVNGVCTTFYETNTVNFNEVQTQEQMSIDTKELSTRLCVASASTFSFLHKSKLTLHSFKLGVNQMEKLFDASFERNWTTEKEAE